MEPEEILQAVIANKMTSKQAFVLINERLRGASVEEVILLYHLSNKIIDHEMPTLRPGEDEDNEVS